MFKELLGELLGTFILVFIGCSSVAIAVLFGNLSLIEVALIWGIGVALAIYIVRGFSHAHLNPAVSLAMMLHGKMQVRKLPFYFFAQLLGGVLAGLFVFLVFQSEIIHFESINNIVRGSLGSNSSAMMFGEFYPNPGYAHEVSVVQVEAVAWEAIGTFILVLVIFRLTSLKDVNQRLLPLFIGLTVTAIICLVAPYTQAGLNPARDFGPRLVALYSGWDLAAFPVDNFGFLTVYILGPFCGGIVATFVHKFCFKSM